MLVWRWLGVRLKRNAMSATFAHGTIETWRRPLRKAFRNIADEERLYFNEKLRRPTKLSVIST
jgi:hypothetical protein